MLFGTATLGIYFYLLANFDSITLSESKNYLIILPILFILALVELFAEIKWGFRKLVYFTKKAFKWLKTKIKLIYQNHKFKRLKNKLVKGEDLTIKETKWLAEFKKQQDLEGESNVS